MSDICAQVHAVVEAEMRWIRHELEALCAEALMAQWEIPDSDDVEMVTVWPAIRLDLKLFGPGVACTVPRGRAESG